MTAERRDFVTSIIGIGHLLPSTAGLLTEPCGVTSRVAWPANAWPPAAESTVGRVTLPERSAYVADREWRGYGKFVAMGVEAAGRALEQSGYLSTPELVDFSCIVGTGKPELTTFARFVEPIANRQVDRIKPLLFPLISRSAIAGQVCIVFGIQGYSQTVAAGEISGAHALHRACELIELGRSSHALAGGVETLSALSLQASRLERVEANARAGLDETEFLPSDGACFVALARTDLTPPGRRVARLGPSRIGRLEPDRQPHEALAAKVEAVLAEAGLSWRDLDFVTSSSVGESNWHSRLEAQVIKDLSARHGREPTSCFPKSITGESEACASIAVVAAAAQLLHGSMGKGEVGRALALNVDDSQKFAIFTLER